MTEPDDLTDPGQAFYAMRVEFTRLRDEGARQATRDADRDKAMQVERAAATETIAGLKTEISTLAAAVDRVERGMARTARQAVQALLYPAIREVIGSVQSAMRAVVQPAVVAVAGLTTSAENAKTAMRRIVIWTTGRLIPALVAGVVVMVAAV